jgi:DNA repair protein RadA/Sms
VVLVGGDPGIGKSTLLLQVLDALSQPEQLTLYVSGEESPGQSRLRSRRMGIDNSELYFYAAADIERIIRAFRKLKPTALVIDSIQTCLSPEIKSPPGTTSQIRQTAAHLVKLAKLSRVPIFIIGHVTKDGTIAGPKLLEHMVDTVLYFEGDSNAEWRVLRGFKNRFGPTSEVGIFEMNASGLHDAQGLAGRFFDKATLLPGSALTVILEGSRPLVIEVQALVAEAHAHPRRSSTGLDTNRLSMLLALLEKKLDIPLGTYDVFVNISGGIKITEPAADLAVIAAILSSYRDRALSARTLFVGEVGLTGEIREVSGLMQRLKETHNQGFTKAVVPAKPIEATPVQCYVADEVAKIVEWMFI